MLNSPVVTRTGSLSQYFPCTMLADKTWQDFPPGNNCFPTCMATMPFLVAFEVFCSTPFVLLWVGSPALEGDSQGTCLASEVLRREISHKVFGPTGFMVVILRNNDLQNHINCPQWVLPKSFPLNSAPGILFDSRSFPKHWSSGSPGILGRNAWHSWTRRWLHVRALPSARSISLSNASQLCQSQCCLGCWHVEWKHLFYWLLDLPRFHKWSHTLRSQCHPVVNWLQDHGILVHRSAHLRHHKPPFETNYCIVTGHMNPILDRRLGRPVTLHDFVVSFHRLHPTTWDLIEGFFQGVCSVL